MVSQTRTRFLAILVVGIHALSSAAACNSTANEDQEVADAPFEPTQRRHSTVKAGDPVVGAFFVPLSDDRPAAISIDDGGPADVAGLESMDVVLSVDDEPVHTVDELKAALRRHRPGATVQLRIERDSKELLLRIKLAVATE
jgi:S1-C subfamily serine protease